MGQFVLEIYPMESRRDGNLSSNDTCQFYNPEGVKFLLQSMNPD